MRGHGCSSHTPGAYHLDDFARDVHQWITCQIGQPAAVYGHSLGALVGINLAARHPSDVRVLMLGDPPLFHHDTPIQDISWQEAFKELLTFMTDHPTSAEREDCLIRDYPNLPPERRTERVRSLEGLDPDVIRAIISNEQMKGINLTDLAAHVICPVLLLRGNPKLGSALREQDVKFALTHLPNIRVLGMETIGHGIMPVELLPQVIEFIDAAPGKIYD
jgi:pimeloyl-ACP methyl ester carboxylesterase